MIIVKFEWTFPDSVIFLPHSYLVIAVWLFCCPYLGSVGRMEDYISMGNNFLSLIKTRRSVRAYKSDPVPSEALDAVLEAGLPRRWTLYWKRGLTRLLAEDINLQLSLQLQTPNIDRRLQN